MTLIARYLIKQLSITTLYAMFALLALYSFFDIVAEVGGVGEGGYTGIKMMQYVLLQIPDHAYQMMPLAVLIGGLIALSQLASGSELTVIKASGMSTKRLLAVLSQFGLIFALATVVLGEWVAPDLSRRAENMKASAINGRISAGASGLWMKEQNNIINVREMLPDHTLLGVKIWQHDDRYQLASAAEAESAALNPDGSWQLKNVRRSVLKGEQVAVSSESSQRWPVALQSGLLDVLLVDPDQMSVSELTTYIAHLKSNHQKTDTYSVAWWRKLMYPIAAWVMALVAFAFTPQTTRHGNMGLKLFGGICLGLVFHFAGRLFGFTSQLYSVPPFLAGMLPTVIFALLAVYLIRRQERR